MQTENIIYLFLSKIHFTENPNQQLNEKKVKISFISDQRKTFLDQTIAKLQQTTRIPTGTFIPNKFHKKGKKKMRK